MRTRRGGRGRIGLREAIHREEGFVKRALVLLGLLVASIARAQPAPIPQRLYLSPGILIGTSRMIALGGAYTGMAETAYGITSNVASIANRTTTENGPWQLSPVFTYMWNFGEYDFDNDGLEDQADASGQYLAGLQFRYRNFGAGTFVRANHFRFCLVEACDAPNKIEMLFWNPTFAVGYSFLDENVIVAGGVGALLGTIENELNLWNYRGLGVELGLLVRPRGLPFRVGISARPGMEAGYSGNNDNLYVAGRQIYEGIAAPGVYSFGVALKVGEGAFTFNDLPPMDAPAPSRALDARNPFLDLVRNRDDPKNGRLLITAQLDVVQSVERVVPIGTFVRTQEVGSIGSKMMYTPRVGLEHLTVPGRFRTRLGSYLEASPYPASDARLHITGGTELFLFRLIDDWAATMTFDLANKYTNFGISLGTWR